MESHTVNNNPAGFACNCIGPRDGNPLCPCRMKNVKVRNGRFIEEIDHGPAKFPEPENAEDYWKIL